MQILAWYIVHTDFVVCRKNTVCLLALGTLVEILRRHRGNNACISHITSLWWHNMSVVGVTDHRQFNLLFNIFSGWQHGKYQIPRMCTFKSGFPLQIASTKANVSMSCRHRVLFLFNLVGRSRWTRGGVMQIYMKIYWYSVIWLGEKK